MTKFNNDPGQKTAPHPPTKVAADTRYRNVADKEVTTDIPKRSLIGVNNVNAGSPPPSTVESYKLPTPLANENESTKFMPKNAFTPDDLWKTKKPLTPTEKKRPVVKAKAPVAREVLVDKSTGAKYDMAKMRDAYEDLGYAEKFKKKNPDLYYEHRGLEYNKPKEESKTPKNFAKGGAVKSSAASRGDGCAQRGKTRGRVI